MNSSKTEADLDGSVICLDSTGIDSSSDDDESFSVSDFVSFKKTLQVEDAPKGFTILNEANDNAKPEKEEKVTSTRNEKKEVEQPMFKVLFRDETVARQYKKRVRDFLHNLVPAEDRKDAAGASNLVLEVWSKKINRKRSGDHLDSANKDEDSDSIIACDEMLFTIDNKPLMQDRLDVPTYGKKFDRIMEKSSGEVKPEQEEKSVARPKMSCWNCLGNHSIRDCPQPRNPMEIAKNRTIFQSRAGPRVGRYHVDDEQTKYGHFVPGQISKDLKRALGIRENELPHHIYRMRMLGYPPGWLKEARLQHSGMNLYDSEGLRELDPMEEPGQIPELGDKDQYDVKKIHDFPGFNVPAPSGTKEQEKMYWKSDQYFMHSKESMLALLSEKKVDGYKRKKLKRSAEGNSAYLGQETVSSVPSEMDVVEDAEDGIIEDSLENGAFVPPLPKTPVRPPLPLEPEEDAADSPKPGNLDLESVVSPSYADSPTLADLERRKKQLLDELEDSNSAHSAPSTPVTSRSCSVVSHVSTSDQPEPVGSTALEATPQPQRTLSALMTPSRGTVKSVALGTPILESTSPYNKLPSVEKFSKDVCDIINFENLPDSTGKYEQMTGILQKVRSTLATIQHD